MKRLAFVDPPIRAELLRYFFREADWTYIREHLPEADDPNPHEIEWAAGDHREHRITYVNDHVGGVQFFAFSSEVPDKENAIERKLLSSPFKVMTREQVMREFEGANDAGAVTRAFGKVSVIAPPSFDKRFEAPVHRVLEHADPDVRAAGLGLLTYMAWPEWMPLIERLRNDSDERVRRKANIVADGYRELGIG